ncbi:MAG: nitronate monooxygenase [Deinococcus sp.]|uniref:nitronate monooxygenase n=1 Tax=Deinococcus sp. TaxID=47478 RepID=UPI0026DB349F|nr:nitronate monooxygenase [Deinococcus sp.]MDO4245135.1 nitronate monooxygenase [Deinococcus sp.]
MTDMTQTPASSTAQASSFAPARLPQIIQGGMGVAVSDWRLAQAVSRTGELGVVSGTGIDNVLVRRLQDGDPEGHVRRALAAYPNQDKAQEIIAKYFIEGGKEPHKPYARIALPTHRNHKLAWELSIAGGFVEVWLAREGHDNPVGLNLLTKLELMTMPALYGAMLAGVDTVIMGAGIPREVPAALDNLSAGRPGTFKLSVKGDPQGETPSVTLDPAEYGFAGMTTVRPKFYPIITSHVLAGAMLRKKTGEIDGFVIEGPTAGGHNAPPRGNYELDDLGQPIYGERDVCDLAEMRKFGLPFWLAGGYGKRGGLQDALAEGAAGIQVGTLFAYAKEAGIRDELQAEVLGRVQEGNLSVYTDPLASPTGFPFKVVQLPETLSNPEVYAARQRICDIGYLREAYWETGEGKAGKVGWRCAAEPVDQYVAKGGKIEDTVGRKCLCNALMADAGLPQVQKNGDVEKSLLTSGDGLTELGSWKPGYTAADAVEFLRGEQV